MRRRSIVLGVVCVLAAVAVVMVARTRLPAPASPAPAGVGSPRSAHADELRKIWEAVAWRADDLSTFGVLTPSQSGELAGAVASRIEFTIDPSFEAWEKLSAEFGAALPKNPADDSQPLSRESFEKNADWSKGMVIDTQRIEVRTLFADGKAIGNSDAGRTQVHPLIRLRYPRPQDPIAEKSTILEVVMPVTILNADGQSVAGKLGVSMWWQGSGARGRWVPYDLCVYFTHNPGRLKPPVL